MDARSVFNRVYNGRRNFLTPKLIKYYSYNNQWAVELSRGELGGNDLFGVTVIRDGGNRYMTFKKFNQMFYSLEEAVNYINGTLKANMRRFDMLAKVNNKNTTRRSITDRY